VPEIPMLPPLGAPALEVVLAAPPEPELGFAPLAPLPAAPPGLPGLESVPLHAPVERASAQIADVTVPSENLTLESAI